MFRLLGFGVSGLGFRVQGLGALRVEALGRIYGWGSEVWDLWAQARH